MSRSSPTSEEPSAKRLKSNGVNQDDLTSVFTRDLLSPSSVASISKQIAESSPYKHAVIPALFEPSFLNRARKELCENVNFSEKETDIYKISQTGDLTNLSGLPAAERSLFPTLISLRDALYSSEFRRFLQQVTGCGPLSGIKTDMSCAEYGQGSYLLNHDDVIGTRRISFILYLVKQEPEWKPEWGGALELYPVVPSEGDRPNIPEPKPSVSIPPAFNQFNFFQVQPGHSFHSVEEVVVEGDGERGGIGSRLSLSGWFHKPVQGEEGYEGEELVDPAKGRSSLQQLYATTLKHPTLYASPIESESVSDFPTESDLSTLSTILNPAYLSPRTLNHLRQQFSAESHLALSSFLSSEIIAQLDPLIRAQDDEMNKGRKRSLVGGQLVDRIPPHTTGQIENEWELRGPPHLQRFMGLIDHLDSSSSSSTSEPLTQLLDRIRTVFESDAFGRLISFLTSLSTRGYVLDVRRFRPGLDYTLARGDPSNHKLDIGLGLTPVPEKRGEEELWEQGEVGGWEVWLDPGNDDEEGGGGDEATYGGGKKKRNNADDDAQGQDEDEEDEGPLLSLEPSWNRLSIVLRDPKVMKFVKYVSAKAPACRWDLSGEWEVEVRETEEDEDDEES